MVSAPLVAHSLTEAQQRDERRAAEALERECKKAQSLLERMFHNLHIPFRSITVMEANDSRVLFSVESNLTRAAIADMLPKDYIKPDRDSDALLLSVNRSQYLWGWLQQQVQQQQ